MESLPLQIRSLGLERYERVWRLQKKAQEALIANEGSDTLFLCEHYPVITLGKSAHKENIVAEREQLQSSGVSVLTVERGGDVTYHGPGQFVAYPIIDLRKRKTDVDWYIRGLERVIIETLELFGLEAVQQKGATGVWVAGSGEESPPSKLASIGIRLSRWCTLHGVSINRSNVREGFALIRGCGFPNLKVTSLKEELGRSVDPLELERAFVEKFCSFFDYAPVWENELPAA